MSKREKKVRFRSIVDHSRVQVQPSARGSILKYDGFIYHFRSNYSPKRAPPYKIYYCSFNRRYSCKMSIKEVLETPHRYEISEGTHDHETLRSKGRSRNKKLQEQQETSIPSPQPPLPLVFPPPNFHYNNNEQIPHFRRNNDIHPTQTVVPSSSQFQRQRTLPPFFISRVEKNVIDFGQSIYDPIVRIELTNLDHDISRAHITQYQFRVIFFYEQLQSRSQRSQSSQNNNNNEFNQQIMTSLPQRRIIRTYQPVFLEYQLFFSTPNTTVTKNESSSIINQSLQSSLKTVITVRIERQSFSHFRGRVDLRIEALRIHGNQQGYCVLQNAILFDHNNQNQSRITSKKRKITTNQSSSSSSLRINNNQSRLTSSFSSESKIKIILPSSGPLRGGDYIDIIISVSHSDYIHGILEDDQIRVKNHFRVLFGENSSTIIQVQSMQTYSKERQQILLQNITERKRKRNNRSIEEEGEQERIVSCENEVQKMIQSSKFFLLVCVVPEGRRVGFVDLTVDLPGAKMIKHDGYEYVTFDNLNRSRGIRNSIDNINQENEDDDDDIMENDNVDDDQNAFMGREIGELDDDDEVIRDGMRNRNLDDIFDPFDENINSNNEMFFNDNNNNNRRRKRRENYFRDDDDDDDDICGLFLSPIDDDDDELEEKDDNFDNMMERVSIESLNGDQENEHNPFFEFENNTNTHERKRKKTSVSFVR